MQRGRCLHQICREAATKLSMDESGSRSLCVSALPWIAIEQPHLQTFYLPCQKGRKHPWGEWGGARDTAKRLDSHQRWSFIFIQMASDSPQMLCLFPSQCFSGSFQTSAKSWSTCSLLSLIWKKAGGYREEFKKKKPKALRSKQGWLLELQMHWEETFLNRSHRLLNRHPTDLCKLR